jgi:hypothetical protein
VIPISEILKQINAEIARLKQVRNILSGKPQAAKPAAKRTRFVAVRERMGEVPRRPRAVEKSPCAGQHSKTVFNMPMSVHSTSP